MRNQITHTYVANMTASETRTRRIAHDMKLISFERIPFQKRITRRTRAIMSSNETQNNNERLRDDVASNNGNDVAGQLRDALARVAAAMARETAAMAREEALKRENATLRAQVARPVLDGADEARSTDTLAGIMHEFDLSFPHVASSTPTNGARSRRSLEREHDVIPTTISRDTFGNYLSFVNRETECRDCCQAFSHMFNEGIERRSAMNFDNYKRHYIVACSGGAPGVG